jgi:hypothetical protein
MLQSAGHGQKAFHNDRAPAAKLQSKHARNFVGQITKDGVSQLLARIGPSRIVALKTHSDLTGDLFAWLAELQTDRQVQIIASYRDPRDICLALREAGVAAIRDGAVGQNPFGVISDLAKARRNVAPRLEQFRKWAAIPGALRLDYDTVAFSPDQAMDAIETALGIKSNRKRAKRWAFEKAHTLKRTARRHRYLEELNEQEKAEMLEVFGDFIRRVCEENDQAWFDECRRNMLEFPSQSPRDRKRSQRRAGRKQAREVLAQTTSEEMQE